MSVPFTTARALCPLYDSKKTNAHDAPLGATIDSNTGQFRWTPGEAHGGATFTVTPNPYGGTEPLTVEDGGAKDKSDGADGIILLEDIPAGEYTITETKAPPGYVKTTDSQSVSVTCDSIKTVTFYNTHEECSGSIKIEKDGVVVQPTLLPGAEFEVSPNPYGGTDPLTVRGRRG